MDFRFNREISLRHGHVAREKVFEHRGVTIVLRNEINCCGRKVAETVWMSNRGWVSIAECRAWVRAN